jgi:hypothetical protein
MNPLACRSTLEERMAVRLFTDDAKTSRDEQGQD